MAASDSFGIIVCRNASLFPGWQAIATDVGTRAGKNLDF